MEFKYSIENLKIGKDTLIFNMGSATNCPSKKLGLCTIDCYAVKTERFRINAYNFREKQELYWLNNDAATIAEDIFKVVSKRNANPKTKNKIKFIRVNEAGDLHTADCLTKLIDIAKILGEALPYVKLYTYTHRKDLIHSKTHMRVPKNLVINTSNFSRKNFNEFRGLYNIKAKGMKDFVNKKSEILASDGVSYACVGDCRKCSLCKVKHTKVIGVPIH